MKFFRLPLVLVAATCWPVAATFAESASPPTKAPAPAASSAKSDEPFAIYKSPTCGCCGEWVDHLTANGIKSEVHHPTDLNAVKAKHGIAPQHQSCHTAISPDGYVFEGHVPANVMQKFLKEKPAGAIGLAVPGMPIGSPGMEVGDKFTPYDVLLINKDGSTAVYQRIQKPADQTGTL